MLCYSGVEKRLKKTKVNINEYRNRIGDLEHPLLEHHANCSEPSVVLAYTLYIERKRMENVNIYINK